MNFREILKLRQTMAKTLVCVGLDLLPEKLPEYIKDVCGEGWEAIFTWGREIIDATADYASMFKPQKAHYEAIPEGQKILQAMIAHIHHRYPMIPVTLDCKRGDIGRTQERYQVAHLEIDGADGMNFSPYMGSACMKSLIKDPFPGNAIIGLGRTSNPEAWEIQDAVLKDGRRVWMMVVESTLAWAEKFGIVEDAGMVMGAAHKASLLNGHIHHPNANYTEDDIYFDHLIQAREITWNKLWYLIPGIGTQGGFIEKTVRSAYFGPGSIAINSSSGINFASQGKDFAEAAREEAKKLRDQINQYI